MNAKKLSLFAVAVLLGAIFVLVVRQVQAVHAADGRHAELIREQSRLGSEINRLRKSLAAEEREGIGLQRDLKTEEDRERADRRALGQDAAASAIRRTLCAWVDLRYQRLFQKLGLTPDQIEKFEALATDHQLNARDIAEEANSLGIARKDPSVSALLNEENAQFQAAEADLLGPEAVQQAEQDDRTAQVRNWVNGLAGNLYTTEPLSATQADSLVQILAEQDPSYRNGGTASTFNLNWDAAATQAGSVLSPSQLAAMKSVQASLSALYDAIRQGNPPAGVTATSPAVK